jgi:hypothetical protein
MADMKVSEEVKGKIGNVIFTLNHVRDGKANRPIASLIACKPDIFRATYTNEDGSEV